MLESNKYIDLKIITTTVHHITNMDHVLDLTHCALYSPVSRTAHECGHALAVLLCGGGITSMRISPFRGNSFCSYWLPSCMYTPFADCFVSAAGPIMGILCAWVQYKNHKPKNSITNVIRTASFSAAVTWNLCNLLPFKVDECHLDGYHIIKCIFGENYTFSISKDAFSSVGSAIFYSAILLQSLVKLW